MPGITGIISKHSPDNNENKLSIMLKTMLHEPFYTSGTYVDRENGFFIGYVSLENSFSDCMPIYNEQKNLVLFITGECYSDQSIIDNLKTQGHKFLPGDASYLVHLYEELGDDFFHDLNGWYNGLLLDLQKGRAILFNDRYGIRRIYYHETNDSFIFSSEAKSLLKAFPSLRKPNLHSIGEYLNYDCILENKTFFMNVFLLPAGSTWYFANDKRRKKKYFDKSILENQNVLDKDQFFEELSATFQRILPRYFFGESIGLSLTGGLDTRLILASRDPVPGELPCYTFSGNYKDIFDVRLAPRVAESCHQPHQVLKIDDNKFLSEYPFHF